mmetsp:Transcript_829/g.2377  ORF Transcript_829/g.2377 Transcript_829/m.2377 type:complete len:81 (-) Transcript_829:24-266(-)
MILLLPSSNPVLADSILFPSLVLLVSFIGSVVFLPSSSSVSITVIGSILYSGAGILAIQSGSVLLRPSCGVYYDIYGKVW